MLKNFASKSSSQTYSTPMMEQYRRIKREHQGEVLFFRLGDFYEMFFEDALEVSSLLNLTLTSRQGQPMCGIPYHAYRSYIARLLKAGKKIAVCEQVSEPGRGLVERRVTEVITPGTTIEEDFLERGNSNYLACFAAVGGFFSLAYIDLSTGDFNATSFPIAGAAERLRGELERIQAKEIIVQESLLNENPALARAVEERGTLVNRWADWLFDPGRGREALERQFGEAKLKGFGINRNSPEIVPGGVLLDYLGDTARSLLPHVRCFKIYGDSEFVGLDESTQRNLELTANLLDGDKRFSLLEVMDETRTAMGRRILKSRLLLPLRSEELINRRLDIVETLYHNQEKLKTLRELLSKMPDLLRLCSRLAMDKAHGKDLVAVKNALLFFGQIEKELEPLNKAAISQGKKGFVFESPEAFLSEEGLGKLGTLRELLERGITEDPSILLSEGNLIRNGYNVELDRLLELKNSGRKLLEDYLEEERKDTGISGLKIKYNRFIGYFFEVTNVNLSKVPPRFIRRQGIAGGERFSTNRLAELESEINGASDRVIELEKKLFLEIRGMAKQLLAELTSAGRRIAETDAAQSFARAATIHGWTRPLIDNLNRTIITEGRHPVVEAHLNRGEFIPNDLTLDASDNAAGAISFALITGPNMAGKSTYLRQAALITIMAQCGSFVPATEAHVGLVDRVYCRVGAQDNLARGESTFLVEMNETAYILNTATTRSFVIMDEVGRGTGTKDGLSIAWAVCEELLNHIKCRTLFATHYHELSGIVHPRMANRSMAVEERNGKMLFLRKLREGPASESYGLHVAALAGLSDTVTRRAGEIMKVLTELSAGSGIASAMHVSRVYHDKADQMQSWEAKKIIKELNSMNLNAITPLEALVLLQKWKKRIDEDKSSSILPRDTVNDAIEPSLFD